MGTENHLPIPSGLLELLLSHCTKIRFEKIGSIDIFIRERPLMTFDYFRGFLPYPFQPNNVRFFGSFWTPLPTPKSDVINGRSLEIIWPLTLMYLFILFRGRIRNMFQEICTRVHSQWVAVKSDWISINCTLWIIISYWTLEITIDCKAACLFNSNLSVF